MGEHYDVAIIGGGSGGYVAAIRAAQLGKSVCLIEEEKVGGTCLHRGCIPTKVLLQTAYLLDSIKGAGRFGLDVEQRSMDYSVTLSRKESIVSQLHKGVEYLLRKNGVTTLAGKGTLVGPHSIQVTGSDVHAVEADAIVVASGSRPKDLPGLTRDGIHVLSSDEALERETPPKSAIILGAGAVGVEFASLWASLGADVTLVEMAPRLTPLEDDAVGDELGKRFAARGITCLTNARLDAGSVTTTTGEVSCEVEVAGKRQRVTAELLLSAVGRSANIEGLGLEDVGVAMERGVITVGPSMVTSVPHIYAVGDVVGGFWLAHKAMHEGVIAAETIAGGHPHPLLNAHIPRTTYCSPQIASIGLSEREAKEQGHDVACGVMPLKANGRALIWGEPEGFCKVVADVKTNDVLGVHMIGHEVTELIAGPALGALLEATPFELGHAVAPHPTLSEILGEAALAVSGQAIHV